MGSKKTSLAWLPCSVVVALLLQGSLFFSVFASEDQWKELRCWPLDTTSQTATVRCQNDAVSSPYDFPFPRDFMVILARWFKGGPVPPLRKDSIPGSGFFPIKLPITTASHSIASRGTTTSSTTTTTTTPTTSSTTSSTTPAPEPGHLNDLVSNEECCCSAPQTVQNLKDFVDEKELFPRVAKAIVLTKPRVVLRAICRADVCDRTARLETRCQQKWKTVAINIYLRNSTIFSRDLVMEDGCECYFIQLSTDFNKAQAEPGRPISDGESVAIEASSTVKAPSTSSSSSVSTPFITTTTTGRSITSVRTTLSSLPTTTSSPPRDSSAVDSTIPEGGTVSIQKLNDVASMLNSSMLALLSVVNRMFSLMGASQNIRNAKGMARKLEETAEVIEIAAKRLLEVDESSASGEDSSTNGNLIQLLLGTKYVSTTTTTLTISTCLATDAGFVETPFQTITSTEIDLETSKISSITTATSKISSITTATTKISSITTTTSKISSITTVTSKFSSTTTIARGTYYVTLTTYVTSTYVNTQTLLVGHPETTVSQSENDSRPTVSNLTIINVAASSKSFPPLTDLVQNYVTVSSTGFSSTLTIPVLPTPSKSVAHGFRPDPKEEKVSVGVDTISKVFTASSLQSPSPLRTSLPPGTTSVETVLVPGTSAFALHTESDVVGTNIKTPRLSTNIDVTSTTPKITATTSTFITGFTAGTQVQLTSTRTTLRSLLPEVVPQYFTGPTQTLSSISESARPKPVSDILSEATKSVSQKPDLISGAAYISVSASQPTSLTPLIFPSPTSTAFVIKTETKPTSPFLSKALISVTTSLSPLTTPSSSFGDQSAALSQSSLPPANVTNRPALDLGSLSGANQIGELFSLAEKLKECLVNQTHTGQHFISAVGAEEFLSKPLEQQMLLMPLWREFAMNSILEDLDSSDTAGCFAELKDSLPLSKVSPNLALRLKSVPKVSGLLIAVFEMTDCVNLRTRCKALVGEDLRRHLAASQAIEKIFTESENSLVSKIYLFEEIERAVEWAKYGSEELITSFPVDTLGTLYAYQSKLKPLLESYQRFCLSQIKSSTQNHLTNTSVVLSIDGSAGSSSDDNSVLDSTLKPFPLNQPTKSSIADKAPDATLSSATSKTKSVSPTPSPVLQDSPVAATTSITRSVQSVLPTASLQLVTTSRPRPPFGISDLNLPKQFFPVSLSPDAVEKLLFGSL